MTAAVPKDGRVKLTLSNGDPLVVDQVIVAVGVKPNTQMAEKSDLEVDPDLDGFLVNTELQARSHLYIVSVGSGNCSSQNFSIRHSKSFSSIQNLLYPPHNIKHGKLMRRS